MPVKVYKDGRCVTAILTVALSWDAFLVRETRDGVQRGALVGDQLGHATNSHKTRHQDLTTGSRILLKVRHTRRTHTQNTEKSSNSLDLPLKDIRSLQLGAEKAHNVRRGLLGSGRARNDCAFTVLAVDRYATPAKVRRRGNSPQLLLAPSPLAPISDHIELSASL